MLVAKTITSDSGEASGRPQSRPIVGVALGSFVDRDERSLTRVCVLPDAPASVRSKASSRDPTPPNGACREAPRSHQLARRDGGDGGAASRLRRRRQRERPGEFERRVIGGVRGALRVAPAPPAGPPSSSSTAPLPTRAAGTASQAACGVRGIPSSLPRTRCAVSARTRTTSRACSRPSRRPSCSSGTRTAAW